MKRYAVLLVPDFRLQATLRHAPELQDQPVALVDSRGKKPRVTELNSFARGDGVETGMTPTQATARSPRLTLLTENAGHERSAQEALLQMAETLSPFLEATAPGVITIEWPPEKPVDASRLTSAILSPLRSMGLAARMGIADNPDLALMASRFAIPVEVVDNPALFLGPLPIAVLQPSEEIQGVLHAWGIHTVGELTALPMRQVCERLGPEAVTLWDRAMGSSPRPLKLVKPQESFVEEADLENPIEMQEPLLFLLRKFLDQLAARLAAVYLVAGKLRLVLRFEKGDPYRRIFTIPQPTREVNLLFRILHTHLENFSSESPIIGLELAAQPVRSNEEQFGLLERGMRDPHQFAETLARLQALLGPDQVGTPEMEASHHPEAFHLRPFDVQTQGISSTDDPLIGIPWLRFRPAVRADVIMDQARPAFLYSERTTGPVKESEGPWLLEGNWWQKNQWTREEWDIVMQDGMYRLIRTGEGWFLDGVYA